MIGDLDRATFSNIEHQSIDFAVHTIRPWLVRIEQSINRALFSEKEKGRFYVQFNMDGLMRGDYKSRMEGYAIARQNGWMSANDIRELENMNPMSDEEGGNTYLVNGNMIPVNLAGITAFLAAAAAVQAEDGDQENTPEQEETQSVENSSRKRRKPLCRRKKKHRSKKKRLLLRTAHPGSGRKRKEWPHLEPTDTGQSF